MAELIKKDDAVTVEMQGFLQTTLRSYSDLRNIPDPYYGFTTLTSRWVEYDRCYHVRARDFAMKQDHAGWSNIVLPDFHDKIETLRVREMNTFFSGAELFETKSRKVSTEEDAELAKKLVKYNFACVPLRTEVSRLILDKYLYGTWIAYVPYVEDEEESKAIRDEVLDAEGNPVEIDGIIQKTQPYEADEIREKKYTDLQYINLKKVWLHPRVKDIQDQPAVFVQREVTYQEAIEMEEEGQIYEGMAQFIKDHGNSNNSLDDELDTSEDLKANDAQTEPEIEVFDIYYGYFWWGEEDDRKVYEAVHLFDGTILGVTERTEKNLPFEMGQHIKVDGAYGVGAGDEMYAAYIAKCTRFNQVFDLSTFEIKGGGFVDSTSLPNFDNLTPGVYQKVVGLAAMLQNKGKPMLSWGDIRGSAPSSTGLEVVQELDRAMQTGTGAVQLLSGMPTDSQVDKTAAGIEATITEGNARVNNYIEDFEDQFFKSYAETCYSNFQEHLDPNEDLPKILDEEDYTYYSEETGEKEMVQFPDVLLDVDIVFLAAKQVLESEKQIGKIQRFMQIMGGVMQVNPEFGQELLRRTDYKFLTEEIARSLGIADLDKLFPDLNVTQELMDCQNELGAVSAQNEMMGTGLEMVMGELEKVGDQAAISVINNVMAQLQEGQEGGQAQGMGEGQPSAPPAV